LGANRCTLMNQLPVALRMAEQHGEMQAAGQDDLFGIGADSGRAAPDLQVVPEESEEWDEELRLQGEKETLGLYLTGHPIERYRAELGAVARARIADLSLDEALEGTSRPRRRGDQPVTVAGLVVAVRQNRTPRGRMASLLLDDASGRIEATLFADVFEQYAELIASDRVLVVSGQLTYDEFRGGLGIRVARVHEFDRAREMLASHLLVHAGSGGRPDPARLGAQLKEVLTGFRGGGCPVHVRYRGETAAVELRLGPEWRVHPSDELLRRLQRLFGAEGVEVVYGAGRRLDPEPRLAGAGSG